MSSKSLRKFSKYPLRILIQNFPVFVNQNRFPDNLQNPNRWTLRFLQSIHIPFVPKSSKSTDPSLVHFTKPKINNIQNPFPVHTLWIKSKSQSSFFANQTSLKIYSQIFFNPSLIEAIDFEISTIRLNSKIVDINNKFQPFEYSYSIKHRFPIQSIIRFVRP